VRETDPDNLLQKAFVAMRELGIDISDDEAKEVTPYLGQGSHS
jgi:hypothetical protein